MTENLRDVNNNIVLIGMMGCGKSTVGKVLANTLQKTFVDMDADIEKQEGQSIAQVFEERGEAYFRQCESAYLERGMAAFLDKGIVLSTGGGIVKKAGHKPLLKALGRVVYLQASPETLINRLEGERDHRPVLRRHGVEELVKERHPLYQDFADDIIIIDGKSIETIIAEIMMK